MDVNHAARVENVLVVCSTGGGMLTMTADTDAPTGSAALGPTHRPPAAPRAFIGFLAIGAALFNVALMLSDRAPGLSKRIFGDLAIQLSDRLNRSDRFGSLTEGRRPGNDDIVHIGVWAVAMTLVGLAIWRWAPLLIAALALFAASVVVEVAQGRYSSTRNVERSDVLANAYGVALGVIACALCYLAWSGAALAIRRLRRD